MRDRTWLIEYLASHMDPLTPVEKDHIKTSLEQFKTCTLETMAHELQVRAKEINDEEYRLVPWFRSLFSKKQPSPCR